MTSLTQLMEANNAAQLQQQLNDAVVSGNAVAEKSAMRQMVALVGAEKAQLMLEIARRAVAERDSRKSVSESQQRVRDLAEAAKRKLAEQQVMREVARVTGIGVAESMKFRLDTKQEKVKARYPKTNMKRSADDFNERVGQWAEEQEADGRHMLKRAGNDPLIVDSIDDEGVFSTLVVKNLSAEDNNALTVDVFNQRHGGDNEYSGKAEHDGPWKFKPMDMSHTSSRDTFNRPTANTDTQKIRGRNKDGVSLRSLKSLAKPGKKDKP